MKRKLSVIRWHVISVAATIMTIPVSAVAQPASPPGQQTGDPSQPPPEAIAACEGKQQANPCQVNTPQGTVAGTCAAIQNQLVCAPEGGPPGSSRGGQNAPTGTPCPLK